MKRKIIQIVDVPDSNVAQGHLTALCNDGTIWYLAVSKWEPIKPQIPQTVLIDENDPSNHIKFECKFGERFPCNPSCESGCS